MASSVMERFPNAYDPDSRGALGSLRAMMDHDLSVFGEIVEMSGSMARIPGYGVHMDGVKVVVRHPGLRVPLRLSVEWDSTTDSLNYSNYDKSANDSSGKFGAVMESKIRVGGGSYREDQSDSALVTSDVFARWNESPAWRHADAEILTGVQRREWNDAAWRWNSNLHDAFFSVFATEQEYGLFLSRMFQACKSVDLSGMSDFRMVKAGRKSHHGLNPFPTTMVDFSTAKVNLGEYYACRKPLVMFSAKLRSYTMPDFLYDGNRIYSPWVTGSRSNLRVMAL